LHCNLLNEEVLDLPPIPRPKPVSGERIAPSGCTRPPGLAFFEVDFGTLRPLKGGVSSAAREPRGVRAFPSRKLIHYEEEKMKNQQQELYKQLPNDVSQFGAPLAEIESIFYEEGRLQK